jgi:acetyl esterase/lipase
MSRWIILLFAIVLLCNAVAKGEERPARRFAVEVHAGLAYKSDSAAEYERERCRLDLYRPDGQTGYPTIVWFHGGGLRNKDANSTQIEVNLANRFAAEGIAVATVNYRLSPQVSFPAYIEDAAAAVAFVHREIGRHGGEAASVFVSGHSAGGYLTAMLGTDPAYLAKHGLHPSDLAGCLPVAGQMVTHSTIRDERGLPKTQIVVDAAAPLFHSGGDVPPFLCIAGDADLPMRAAENRLFVAALQANSKRESIYLEVPDRNHGTIASRISEPGDPAAAAMQEFIQRHQGQGRKRE